MVAAIAASMLLGGAPDTGLDPDALNKAILELSQSTDAFEKGVGLLFAKKSAEAADPLAHALKERQRQLTPFASEIYAAASFTDRPSRRKKIRRRSRRVSCGYEATPFRGLARKLRSDALVKAGKPEAAR